MSIDRHWQYEAYFAAGQIGSFSRFAREKLPLISHLKLPCIQIGEEAYHTFWYAIDLSSKSHLHKQRTSLQVCMSWLYSHVSGVSLCDRFACVVSEDFSEFLGVQLVFLGSSLIRLIWKISVLLALGDLNSDLGINCRFVSGYGRRSKLVQGTAASC